MSDYHLHLHPHEPADFGPPAGEYPTGYIDSYVATADARGVEELGFTEHLYRCVEAASVLGRFWEAEPDPELAAHTAAFVTADQNLSLDSYVATVVDAKDRGLPVKLGLEIDFFPETIDAVLELIAPYPWDFLIGSVHWIGGWAIDSFGVSAEFDRRGVDQAWVDYFEIESQLAASGKVDVLAHVDLPKKYGHRPSVEPLELYRMVVDAASASGTAVEVSSQGLRKPAGEVYPSPAFLRMFADSGVPITLASDAHIPADAGWGRGEIVKAAREAGYETYLRFEGGRRIEVPLGTRESGEVDG